MRIILLLTATALSPVVRAQPVGVAANFQGHGLNNSVFTCGPAFTPVSKPPGGLPSGPTTQGSVNLMANCDNGSVEATLTMSANPGTVTVAPAPDQSGVYSVTPSVVMTFQLSAKFSTPKTGSFLAHINLIANGLSDLRCHISDGTFQFNQTATIQGPGSTTLSTSQTCTLPALGRDGSPPIRYFALGLQLESRALRVPYFWGLDRD